jgi:phenylacetate-CoA ligase
MRYHEDQPVRRWLARNVFFPLQERLKGHPTFEILNEMELADSLSTDELEKLRGERLRQFLSYCLAHVPYVRAVFQRAGLRASDVGEPSDLKLLPIMTKAEIRKHREELRSDIAGKLTAFATGGSTGEPLIFDLSKRRIASRVACRRRFSRWWGVSPGDPEFALWGSPLELTRQDWVRRQRDKLLRTTLLSAFEMKDETMSRYLDILEQQTFRQIFAYPSAIYLLCLHARKQGRNLRRLGIKVVFVTGEVLFVHQRDLISEVLNCPVANGYGGRDSGCIAHECPQGGMHVMADATIVEIVDSEGRPVPPGEAGEIVVTDLYSHEAPFIRYATGDIGVSSTRLCRCGKALPLLERIDGRSNDSIVAPDGRLINSLALVYPLREIEGIEHYRICQKRTDCFHVQMVCNDAFRVQEGEERIRAGWEKLLRTPVAVMFEYLPKIDSERSGKFRHVVSEVPQPVRAAARTGTCERG